jgi:hypothetical protein
VSEGQLFLGLLVSCVGAGYFLYGKQQRAPVPLVCGVALAIYPYFVANLIAMAVIGIVLAAIPYFFRD